MRILSFILLVSISPFSISQTRDNFFDGTLEEYTLWDLREYYSNNYPDFEERKQAIEKRSERLAEKNTDVYLLNRIYYCQFLFISNHRKEAVEEIAKLEKFTRIHRHPKLKGYFFNVKGGEQFSLNRAERGRNLYKKALHSLKIARDTVGIKANYINIANSFAAQEPSGDSATYYFNLALEIENAGCTQFSKALRLNYSRLLITRDEFRKAISLLTIPAFDSTHLKDTYSKVIVEMNLADAYFRINQNDSAIIHYAIARKLALREGLIQIPAISRGLAFAYERENDFRTAFNLMRESDSLDKIFQNEQIASLSEEMHLTLQKEAHKKETELNRLEIAYHKSQNTLLYIFFGICIGFILFLLIMYLKIRSKNKTLARKNLQLTESMVRNPSKETKNTNKQASKELIEQIEIKLYHDKVFTDPELTLEKLAKKLNTNRTYLSENVNHHFGKPFRSVINQLRIQEACQMLSNEKFDHYSIEGVAISVGYRNLSSFNSTFKRETGITPSFFRKNAPSS